MNALLVHQALGMRLAPRLGNHGWAARGRRAPVASGKMREQGSFGWTSDFASGAALKRLLGAPGS